MIWECNRVEVASIDPANETYEINNIDFSELYCDECHDKIYNS